MESALCFWLALAAGGVLCWWTYTKVRFHVVRVITFLLLCGMGGAFLGAAGGWLTAGAAGERALAGTALGVLSGSLFLHWLLLSRRGPH